MNPRPRPLLVQIVSAAIFCFFFFISLRLFHGAAAADDLMESCLRRSSTCGRLENLSYPFWMDYLCGNDGFEVTDCGDPDSDPLILILGEKFRLVRTYLSPHKVTLSANEFYETACPSNPVNVSLQHRFLSYSSTNQNLFLFYNCSGAAPGVPAGNRFWCHGEEEVIYANDSALVKYGAELAGCGRVVQVKVNETVYGRLERKTLELDQALKLGFDVDYNFRGIFCSQCEQTFHGRCLANNRSPSFLSCQPKGSNSRINWELKLLAGAASAIVGILILSILAWKMRDQARKSFGLARDPTIEAFIRNHGTLSPRRYKFSEVKRITSSFKRKLGQGGYGGVYQGKLEDGRLVAVKVLNTSKGDGQDFINEVASISRTSHVNVVSLLGFCLEGKTRALIYEFMPNGSLEKFIFKKNDLTSVEHLGWEKLYNIALGIARGLQYLHQGCNTRIVHFDIKPHNILLDENFHPKISDFGLAKLCTRNESILSMMEARGTIGYIAPEVFSRNFGVVSHKSDVYSYGMMVLEMAGGRRNLDVQVSQTSEVYFPHLVYRHLEQGTEPKLQGIITSEGMEIVRKMIMVGLWCIQPCPSDRPSMSKVLEMFEGSIEALQIPPNPFLSSPPRLPQESTSTLSP